MKRVISILIIIFMSFSYLIPFLENNQTSDVVNVQCMVTSLQKNKTEYEIEKIVLQNSIEIAIKEMQSDMSDIENIKNQRDWYIAYNDIISKYDSVLDPPETIYDYFTDEEIYLIQRVIETECYDQTFDSKCNVASVILNRINIGDDFGNSVEQIITSQNQFVYTRKEISDDTILAVEYAFEIQDTTFGCIAFRSDKKVAKWYDWKYMFTDDAGHHFYKMDGE